MYRIKEVEFSYDDIYETVEEALEVIQEYIKDDGSERDVAYYVVDDEGNTVEIVNA